MEKVGACKIVLDKDCNAKTLEKSIEEMLSKDAKQISEKQVLNVANVFCRCLISWNFSATFILLLLEKNVFAE